MIQNRLYISICIFFLMMGVFGNTVFASNNTINIVIDGKETKIPNSFKDKDETVFISLNDICNSLDANISYENKKYYISSSSNTIEFSPDKNFFTKNSIEYKLQKKAVSKSNKIYVPISFIKPAFNFDVKFDKKTNTVDINRNLPKRIGISNSTMWFMVDNHFFNPLNIYNSLVDGQLVIPISPLAEYFKGSYLFDKKSKKAILKIDGTIFEFEENSNDAYVDGKKVTLPCKPRLEQGNLMVCSQVFENNLKSYDAVNYEDKAMVIRLKGKLDYYDALGNEIGEHIPSKFKTQAEELLALKDKAKIKEINDIADNIVKKLLKPDMSDFEKVMAVNKFIVDNTKYDRTLKSSGKYDALTKNLAICQGYAYSTALLLEKMGIENKVVTGFAGVDSSFEADKYELLNYDMNGHAWNLVKIDGQYYHIDTTWNDPIGSTPNYYEYFLLTDEEISYDHVWRRGFFPKSAASYADKTLEQLRSNGGVVATIKLSLNGKLVSDQDIAYINISTSHNGEPCETQNKIVKLTNEKNTGLCTILYGKEVNKSNISLNVEGVAASDRVAASNGEFYVCDFYDIQVSGSYPNWEVSVTPKTTQKLTGQIIFPNGIELKESTNFKVNLQLLKKIDNGFSSEVYNVKNCTVKVKPGQYIIPFEFTWIPPNYEYYYIISYSSSETYLGESKVITQYLPLGYIDNSGNIVQEEQIINSTNYPLKEIVLKIPKNPDWQEPEKDNGTIISGEVFDELNNVLKKYNFTNYKLLKELKTLEDAEKLEGSKPNESSKNSIYYTVDLPSGINVYRVYNHEENSDKLNYTISFNDVNINEDNYLSILNLFNTFLKDSIGTKTLATLNFYVFEKGYENIKDYKNEELFKMIIDGKAKLEYNYSIDNVSYQINLGGYSGNARLSVTCTIRSK